jgi:predicted aspartyl protease
VLAGTPVRAAVDDPPPDLIATSTTLAKVRALYLRSQTPGHTKNAMLIETWRLSQDNQTGTFKVWRLGKDYREVTTLGPLVYQNGVRGGTRWQQNRNGITFAFAGIHERDAIDEHAWDSKDSTDVHLIGESVPYNAYVVDVNPALGRHEWLFIDKRTGTIVRRERIERRRRFVTSYDDFKPFDGVLEPSRVRTTDSLGNDREQTIVSRQLDSTPEVKDLDVPPSRRDFVEFPAGTTDVKLPVRFVNGLMVVRVYLDYRPYDFLLDSGAAGIVIDPTVAESLGLERYGARVGATVGSFAESTSIVPFVSVGRLRMRDVVTRVVTVPFHTDEHTRIAGLLGFDFFSGAVVHVDEERGLVEALEPATFKPPADAVQVPLALDDKQPAARIRVGSVAARVIVDTGANRTVLSARFARRADLAADNPTEVASRFSGVGGIGTAETMRVRSLEFAGVTTDEPLIDVTPAELGVEDIDGVLGSDLLRSYDVYFNYRANELYARRPHRAVPP